ncbi:uncharacterized protein LOC113147075 [Cyclospora cayetanensis]|uniref:Uncharacterized protein LOC113147075 n=1 Tax=Cyclospora cayetanensis TaxID=88456 RepID=A0A6P6RXJ9_9EIME|nr:uncharacterized protein LOC113147075 [Cyclospora cayetanensis]
MGVALGSYIDQHGLEQLGKYRYVSAGSTPIDRLMQPFWDAVVSFIPMTLDAVDGKQARRTNTSTPLGQLFDHGCDSFSTVSSRLAVGDGSLSSILTAPSVVCVCTAAAAAVPPPVFLARNLRSCLCGDTASAAAVTACVSWWERACAHALQVFAALSVLGTIRVGISVAAFMLIAILQMQLFIYTWWELHFHEYRCHTGVTGVTEGQLVMMGMNIVALVFGPEIFTTSLADVVPTSFLGTLSGYLLTLPIQAFLAFPFYLLLIGMLGADVINGCRHAKRPRKAASMMDEHPVLCYWAMVCNTSIVALRLNLSATCRMEFTPIQWPILPFWLCCVWLYIISPDGSGVAAAVMPQLLHYQQQQQLAPYGSTILLGVLLWSGVYLASLLLSTISLICYHFNIRCFGVGENFSKQQ